MPPGRPRPRASGAPISLLSGSPTVLPPLPLVVMWAQRSGLRRWRGKTCDGRAGGTVCTTGAAAAPPASRAGPTGCPARDRSSPALRRCRARARLGGAPEGCPKGDLTMHDLVIRGGTVVDGTGAVPRTADVAVDGGRITEVGSCAGAQASRTVDADGLLVTPGFVDIHTHYDGQATWDEVLAPSQLARGDHRRHRQLRRRVRPGASRPPRLADRAHGGRRGHPRHRAGRGHDLGLGDLPRVPRRARPAPAGRSTSAPRSPTGRCAPTSWASAAPATSRPRPRTSPA